MLSDHLRDYFIGRLQCFKCDFVLIEEHFDIKVRHKMHETFLFELLQLISMFLDKDTLDVRLSHYTKNR